MRKWILASINFNHVLPNVEVKSKVVGPMVVLRCLELGSCVGRSRKLVK